jgi:hypothetical protein
MQVEAGNQDLSDLRQRERAGLRTGLAGAGDPAKVERRTFLSFRGKVPESSGEELGRTE